jgi:hypothetical protein
MSVSKLSPRPSAANLPVAKKPTDDIVYHSAELADEAKKWTQPPVVRRDDSPNTDRSPVDASVRYDLD